ncbi:hypothetical protein ABT009_16025 [Streptomyces sp. NPDC002896]|uniref:hypothetical protein n=1 Tax=Streptomyces sp. NPDC002896 TaxID=3154438 RepID=UPI003332C2A5
MTDHTRPPARICPACDGFASAAISLGVRNSRGHRRTITVHCRDCHGTGTLPARTATLTGGRA